MKKLSTTVDGDNSEYNNNNGCQDNRIQQLVKQWKQMQTCESVEDKKGRNSYTRDKRAEKNNNTVRITMTTTTTIIISTNKNIRQNGIDRHDAEFKK